MIDYIAVIYCNYCGHKKILKRKDLVKLSEIFKIPLTNNFIKNLPMYLRGRGVYPKTCSLIPAPSVVASRLVAAPPP